MNPLAVAVDGARWIRHDPAARRVFVWRADSDLIEIVHEDSGELIGNWPCERTAEAAALTATERVRSGY